MRPSSGKRRKLSGEASAASIAVAELKHRSEIDQHQAGMYSLPAAASETGGSTVLSEELVERVVRRRSMVEDVGGDSFAEEDGGAAVECLDGQRAACIRACQRRR